MVQLCHVYMNISKVMVVWDWNHSLKKYHYKRWKKHYLMRCLMFMVLFLLAD